MTSLVYSSLFWILSLFRLLVRDAKMTISSRPGINQ
jgi:hypothetical protein